MYMSVSVSLVLAEIRRGCGTLWNLWPLANFHVGTGNEILIFCKNECFIVVVVVFLLLLLLFWFGFLRQGFSV